MIDGSYQIGWFDNSKFHGYAKQNLKGNSKEGLFENGKLIDDGEESKLEGFVTQKVDWE